MRRIALGSFAVLAGLTFVLFTGCQRENSLRVVGLNDGKPYTSDLVDYGIINDPEGEPEEIEVVPDDFCKIGLQYVEIGLGLPTWTPYQANIEQVQVTLEPVPGIGEQPDELPPLVLPMKMVVMADRTGSEVVDGEFVILSSWYKQEYFEQSESYVLKATIKVSGTDDATGEKVEATGIIQLSVSDYWDDPNSIGN